MKNIRFLIFLFVVSAIPAGFSAKAQNSNDNPFINLQILNALESAPQPSSQIKDIQVTGEQSGITFTSDKIYRTNNNGETWNQLNLPKSPSEKIGAVSFFNETIGWAILADTKFARLEIAKTQDGGNNWQKMPVNLQPEDLQQADLENASLRIIDPNNLSLSLRLPTSSNFSGKTFYESRDGGNSWNHLNRAVEKNHSDNNIERNSRWTLKSDGNCEGFKTGCVQETKIFDGADEITPPQIKNLARI
jgi:photosystem II stability/assembly factor-like uncharacterized protein